MDLGTILGGLGTGLAGISIGWQILSRRVRLRVKVDREGSEFTTVTVLPNFPNVAERETCTGIRIVIGISNVSVRPNTVVRIQVEAPAQHELLPANANFVTAVREAPNRLFSPMTDTASADWAMPREWTCPYRLEPGDQHEAGLAYLLAGEAQSPGSKLRVKVIVTDAYEKRYRRSIDLRHR